MKDEFGVYIYSDIKQNKTAYILNLISVTGYSVTAVLQHNSSLLSQYCLCSCNCHICLIRVDPEPLFLKVGVLRVLPALGCCICH